MKRGRMRRLHARFAAVSSGRRDKRRRRKLVCGVTVRANYVALPFAAGRGADEGGESRPDQGSSFSPVRTRKYGPLAKNPAMERRKAKRFRRTIASHAVPEAKRYKMRLAALHAPRMRARTRQASRAH